MSLPALSFADLPLSDSLKSSVAALGFESPTPIQAACIPVLLAGRDVIGQSQTGSGKTFAYGLPLLQSLNAAQYTPSKHKAGATGRGYPHGRPSAGGAGQPLQPLPLELNGTPRHVEPTPLFGAGLGELVTEQLDPNGISNWLI